MNPILKKTAPIFFVALFLTACGGGSGGGNSGAAGAAPGGDAFLAFVQQLTETAPDNVEPETIDGVVISENDNSEPFEVN